MGATTGVRKNYYTTKEKNHNSCRVKQKETIKDQATDCKGYEDYMVGPTSQEYGIQLPDCAATYNTEKDARAKHACLRQILAELQKDSAPADTKEASCNNSA